MVAIITAEQKEMLSTLFVDEMTKFNPIQDDNNEWVISEEEIQQCDIQWVKDLVLSAFVKKPQEPLL